MFNSETNKSEFDQNSEISDDKSIYSQDFTDNTSFPGNNKKKTNACSLSFLESEEEKKEEKQHQDSEKLEVKRKDIQKNLSWDLKDENFSPSQNHEFSPQ